MYKYMRRYCESMEKVRKGGGDNAVLRHMQRNKKLCVWDRLRQFLDGEDFLELSPFAGLGMPYGDVPSAGHLVGVVANKGELTYEAALKGSHFVQLCDQRGIPLIFLKNTPPYSAVTATISEVLDKCLRIIKQQVYQLTKGIQSSPVLRM
ncbi:UNVERIFIED_CONTAM: hypothetical protein FKN15_076827 [Acipenser sinensis]